MRDIANPSPSDPYFTTFRYFDFFVGMMLHGISMGACQQAMRRGAGGGGRAVSAVGACRREEVFFGHVGELAQGCWWVGGVESWVGKPSPSSHWAAVTGFLIQSLQTFFLVFKALLACFPLCALGVLEGMAKHEPQPPPSPLLGGKGGGLGRGLSPNNSPMQYPDPVLPPRKHRAPRSPKMVQTQKKADWKGQKRKKHCGC